jgi:hypothetical protein
MICRWGVNMVSVGLGVYMGIGGFAQGVEGAAPLGLYKGVLSPLGQGV